MPFIDVHAHLDHPSFASDLPAVIERAKKAGVAAIICNGVNPTSNRAVLQLAKTYPIIKAALGIYPLDTLAAEAKHESKLASYPDKPAPFDIAEELAFIRKQKDKIIAIGEIGLDNYWVKELLNEQLVAFHQQLKLASQLRKPVIVHSRAAEQETIDALESSNAKKAVMHCFGGGKKLVKRIENNGWWLSIPPNIMRGSHFQMIAKEVGVNQLLTETDAPYLAPEKDQRNEPAFVALTVKKIAEIKKLSVEDAAAVIFKNYQDVFW